jgi:hypothetical protein
MAATLNTSLTRLIWTNIMTRGLDSDVIVNSSDDLTLFMGLNIDLSLFDQGYGCSVNFRLIEVATNQAFNHYWWVQLDSLRQWAPSMWLSMSWQRAAWAGVRNGAYSYFFQGQGTDYTSTGHIS